MAGIAQKIETFNLAYQFAWKHISEDQKRKQPNIAQRLHDSIRRHLKEGAAEAVFIASDALNRVGGCLLSRVERTCRTGLAKLKR